jgi:hypothetical protein
MGRVRGVSGCERKAAIKSVSGCERKADAKRKRDSAKHQAKRAASRNGAASKNIRKLL